MSNILPFKKKPAPRQSLLCKNNHHKWKASKQSQFDVKQGKLVTVEVCSRCGKKKHLLT